jgi:cobalamin biosynthesis protein CobT
MTTTVKKPPTLKKIKYDNVETVYHIESGLVFRSMQDRTVIARLVNGDIIPMNNSFIELAKSHNFKFEIQQEEEIDDEGEEENEDEDGEENDNGENDNEENEDDEDGEENDENDENKEIETTQVSVQNVTKITQVNSQPSKVEVLVNPELKVQEPPKVQELKVQEHPKVNNMNEISLLFANHISELQRLENLVNQKLSNSDTQKQLEEELRKCRAENESNILENHRLREELVKVNEMYEALNLKFTMLKKMFS